MEENKNVKKSKLKVVTIVFIIVIFILGAIAGAGYFYYNYLTEQENEKIVELSEKYDKALLDYSETLEYGSEISYNDLLNKVLNTDELNEDIDIKIFINDEEILKDSTYKFESVGEYNIKVSLSSIYKYTIITKKTKEINNSKESKIIVQDTKIPIISGVSNKEITVGDEINLLDGINAQDEIDGQLEVTIDGVVDNQKAGEYKIKLSSADKNGNVTEQEFIVIVKEKVVEPQPNNTTTSKNSSNTSKNSSNNSNSKTTNSSNSASSNNSTASSSSGDASTKNGRLQLATAEAKRVVSKIIKPGMSDYDKAYAICNYLHNSVSRQTNQSNEAYQTNYGNEAYAALVMKKAACSGFCKAVTLMCNAAGLQSKHINANQWTHQWNTVLVGGEWIILDAQGGIFGGTVHPLQGY